MKKRYAALMIVISLVGGATLLSMSLSPSAENLRTTVKEAILTPASENQTNQLTDSEAEDIALGSVGLSRDGVVMERTELDRERGQWVWEVEFYRDGVEYDFEIEAYTGEILKQKQEKEGRPSSKPADPAPEVNNPPADVSPEPTPDANGLTEEQATEIALADAGLSADQVTRLKVEKDRDDGVWEYEIEFKKDGMEYDYEIRISDGKILQRDIEWDD